jgi:hypothetical protein
LLKKKNRNQILAQKSDPSSSGTSLVIDGTLRTGVACGTGWTRGASSLGEGWPVRPLARHGRRHRYPSSCCNGRPGWRRAWPPWSSFSARQSAGCCGCSEASRCGMGELIGRLSFVVCGMGWEHMQSYWRPCRMATMDCSCWARAVDMSRGGWCVRRSGVTEGSVVCSHGGMCIGIWGAKECRRFGKDGWQILEGRLRCNSQARTA